MRMLIMCIPHGTLDLVHIVQVNIVDRITVAIMQYSAMKALNISQIINYLKEINSNLHEELLRKLISCKGFPRVPKIFASIDGQSTSTLFPCVTTFFKVSACFTGPC
jgi:hypothetical protein